MGASESALEEVVVHDNRLNHPQQQNLNKLLPSGETTLTALIEGSKDVKVLEQLINAGADVNFTNKHGDTPLIYAVRSKDAKITQAVLSAKNINPNKHGRFDLCPMQIAAAIGNSAIVELLLKAGANPDGFDNRRKSNIGNSYSTPLLTAIKDENIVAVLLQYGASVNLWNPLIKALEFPAVANQIIDSDDLDVDMLNSLPQDVLATAAKYHNCQIVHKLVEKGLKIVRTEQNPSVTSTKRIDPETHSNSAYSTDATCKYRKETGVMGLVIHYGCWECFQYLLPLIADINFKDMQGRTMLEYAFLPSLFSCYCPYQRSKKDHLRCLKNHPSSQFLSKVSPYRIKFAKFLLKEGADLSQVWNASIWSYEHRATDHDKQRDARLFCIKAYHSPNNERKQSMFRMMGFIGDFEACALIYLDGYYPTVEDIATIENKVKRIPKKYVLEDTSFTEDNIDKLREQVRSLKNVAVMEVRKAIGPNIYAAVRHLPLPEKVKDTILLECPLDLLQVV